MPPKRPRPRDLGEDWPRRAISDPIGEVARRFALALQTATIDMSLREAAQRTGVDHTTIASVLRGNSWPDLATIARLETGLQVHLWPSDVVGGGAAQK